ncbi:RNA polymerase sigma-70 factor, ECF subfamily [Franzmannia pantelleriensis]|uniref:RNA polymerase sigma-70 factor, ECF subfamily n=1 Tax=Franzmannia pantelleriensis TaxID=48727 RepID=A0A1G9MKV5_9GAMM|nr:sigma-70 family RNA polymerase sigma factor [Halomonas pantelleriensis]SDL74906.1 RNA polymerase sigma-70 factor, ECF subfamily [Halomonas pantelleriensis]
MSEFSQDPLVTSLAACAQGDGKALERLYRLASPHLYAQLLRIVRNESAAQDCLQQVFIRVWQSAGQYDASRAKPMTWLSTLTRNIGIDWLRRQRPQEADGQALIDELAGLDDPAADGQRDQESGQLHECLEILPSQQRRVLELAFFQGLTHSELATAITQPLGTVKSWVRRGLERLKACLTTGN